MPQGSVLGPEGDHWNNVGEAGFSEVIGRLGPLWQQKSKNWLLDNKAD